ncbi:hypothetical protein JNK13_05570 [bacterium]|nr:hypothetical protein [bacterium]
MKKYLLLLTLIMPLPALADELDSIADELEDLTRSTSAFSDVCKSVASLPGCLIYKGKKQSAHIPRNNPRHKSGSLIAKRGCAVTFSGKIVDNKGNRIASWGPYTPAGALYKFRYYGCGTPGANCQSTKSMASKAKANTGSVTVFAVGKTGKCYRIPNPTKCYNSSTC